MKTKQSYTTTYFIIGILIGLAFAIMYSIKNKHDIKIQDTNFVEPIEKNPVVIIDKETKKIENKKDKKRIKNKNRPNKKKKIISKTVTDSVKNPIKKITSKDSILTDTLYIDTIIATDSIIINSDSIINSDTLIEEINDSIEYELFDINNNNPQEISISKDELIYASLSYPEGKRDDFACKSTSKYDSVLVNNIPSTKEGLYVEIWQSPINLIGYKLTTNTLVLYGIYEYDKIKLRYTKNGAVELKYKNNTVILECTDIFKPIIIK